MMSHANNFLIMEKTNFDPPHDCKLMTPLTCMAFENTLNLYFFLILSIPIFTTG